MSTFGQVNKTQKKNEKKKNLSKNVINQVVEWEFFHFKQAAPAANGVRKSSGISGTTSAAINEVKWNSTQNTKKPE